MTFLLLVSVAFTLASLVPSTALAEPVAGVLGAACEGDGDCDSGLRCITVGSDELSGRGPASGLCTRDCVSDDDCAAWPPATTSLVSTCESFGGRKLCFEPCEIAVVYAAQCHYREDLACHAFGRLSSETRKLGGCVPLCTSDAQCAGRHCNPALGLCQDEPVVGDPVGSSCDPRAPDPTCAGLCEASASGEGGAASQLGTCSELCVYAGPFGCGWSGRGTPRAACFGPDVGDEGRCYQLCDCDADCDSNFGCAAELALYGRAGGCIAPERGYSHLPECLETPALGQCLNGPERPCQDASGCLGVAHCLPDTSGYAACECLDALVGAAGGRNDGFGGATGGADAGEEAGQPIGGENFGPPAGEGGATVAPNRSGKTPESGCACGLHPGRTPLEWIAGASLLALLVLRRCVGGSSSS